MICLLLYMYIYMYMYNVYVHVPTVMWISFQMQIIPPHFVPNNEFMSVFRAAVTQSHMSDDALEELSQVWIIYMYTLYVLLI